MFIYSLLYKSQTTLLNTYLCNMAEYTSKSNSKYRELLENSRGVATKSDTSTISNKGKYQQAEIGSP